MSKYEKLRKMAQLIAKNQNDDWDLVLCVSGSEGAGKSCLAMHIAMHVCKLHGLPFSIENNIVYKNDELLDKVKNLPHKAPIILDEAVLLSYKRDWASAENKQLVRMFHQIRAKNMCFIFCIPRFIDMDAYYRTHRVRFWLHVYDRGKVVAFVKDENQNITDPWHFRENLEAMKAKRILSHLNKETHIHFYRKSKNYFTDFHFPDFPEAIKEKYREISLQKKMESVKDAPRIEGKWEKRCRMYFNSLFDEGLTLTEISKKMGVTRQTLWKWKIQHLGELNRKNIELGSLIAEQKKEKIS